MPKPTPQARVRSSSMTKPIADTLSDYPSGDGPEEYLSNGLSRLSLRRLRRSNVEDSLDLHGNTIDSARLLLQQFLLHAANQQLRCVQIIHGKGLNSRDGEAVLRTHTRHWLMQHQQVLAYCPALPRTGGSGALLVLLKTLEK